MEGDRVCLVDIGPRDPGKFRAQRVGNMGVGLLATTGSAGAIGDSRRKVRVMGVTCRNVMKARRKLYLSQVT